MSADLRRRARWGAIRYGRLLPLTAHSRAAGRAYAAVVAAVELRLEPARRAVATRRITRWLTVHPHAAQRIYRDSLRSEAREEADSTFFMHHPAALAAAFRVEGLEPEHRGATIYAILHFGSPILAYLHLARTRRIAVHAVGRALDASNPMPDAKRRYGTRKVAWVHALSGRPFVGVDAPAVLHARELLLAGDSLYAAIDVPGDVVARAAEITIHNERLSVSAGIPTLAAITHTPIQPILAISEATTLTLHYPPKVHPTTPQETLERITTTLFHQIDLHPTEWWLWPYLPPATPR